MRTALWFLIIVGNLQSVFDVCRASDENKPSENIEEVSGYNKAEDFPEQFDDIACSADTRPLELTDGSGWFTSPNFPANYYDLAHCRWLIKSTSAVVVIDFTFFQTEYPNDRIYLYDGNNTSDFMLEEVTGIYSQPLTGIRSTGSQLLAVFRTDSIRTYRGFNATYTSSDVMIPDPCNPNTRPLQLTDVEGYFQSNGFPTIYKPYLVCEWLFTSQFPDGFVQIDFDVFATANSYDIVRVYDGRSASAPLLGQLTGKPPSSAKTFQSSQPYLFVRFNTDSHAQDIGFNGTYKSLMRPTTTAFPPGLCGTNLHVSPSEATILPTHDIMCQLDQADTNYLNTDCIDLIQNLPGIGNAHELLEQGGNFGCYRTTNVNYDDAQNACFDRYQWDARLGQCGSCTRMYVCIRFP